MNLIALSSPHVLFYVVIAFELVTGCLIQALHIAPTLGNGFGNSSTRQTTITTDIANAFNTSNSYAKSFTGGDTTLTLGGGSEGTTGLVGSLIPLVLAVFAGLAALYLLIRTK